MEEAFCEYLLTRSAVTTLIGSGSAARLWPDVIRQPYSVEQGPCATYQIISTNEEHYLLDRTGFVQSRMQITTTAKTRKAANETARAIKNCGLTALKGVNGGIDFRGISIEDGIRNYVEPPQDGTQEYRYLAEFDLMVSYLEE